VKVTKVIPPAMVLIVTGYVPVVFLTSLVARSVALPAQGLRLLNTPKSKQLDIQRRTTHENAF